MHALEKAKVKGLEVDVNEIRARIHGHQVIFAPNVYYIHVLFAEDNNIVSRDFETAEEACEWVADYFEEGK
jgi:hypothetical protein